MSVSCAICMNSFDEEANKEVVAVKCGHTFHKTCIMEWKNSSKQLTCPECRTKYTERGLKKLFLNVIPKSDEFHTGQLFDQLQEQRQQASSLKKDKERLTLENNVMQNELFRFREEFRKLSKTTKELEETHAVKCQAYSIISVINDEYLSQNELLRDENSNLKRRLHTFNEESEAKKAKVVTLAKPFVDLTNDDENDSDVEVIEATPKSSQLELSDSDDDIEITPVNHVEKKEIIPNDCKSLCMENNEPLIVQT